MSDMGKGKEEMRKGRGVRKDGFGKEGREWNGLPTSILAAPVVVRASHDGQQLSERIVFSHET